MRSRRLMVVLPVLGVAALVCSGSLYAQWSVRQSPGTGKCILQSDKKSTTDGYQQTTVHLVVKGGTVTAVSKSVLDPGFTDTGLLVDRHQFIPVDRVENRRAAVFEKQYATIIEQFIRGREVTVRLRYWPTWPATGVHPVVFSLVGFTAALKRMRACR